MNLSTITYGVRKFWNVSADDFANPYAAEVELKFGCSNESPALCGTESYRLLNAHNASRFYPYASVDKLEDIPSAMIFRSMYLANDRLYRCGAGSKPALHPEYKSTY